MYGGYFRDFDRLVPLGTYYKGIPVVPTNKIFYDEYPYRISIKGNKFHYDIDFHVHLNKFLYDNFSWHYQSNYTSKNRNINLKCIEDVDTIVEAFADEIDNIHGPINQENIETIKGSKYPVEYRDKYWYGKYNRKLCFFAGLYHEEDTHSIRKEIAQFVADNFEDYRWYDHGSKSWYQNFVYVKDTELEDVIGFLKISYGDYLENITICKIMETKCFLEEKE